MLNKINIMGRLTKDPELKSTASGLSVASFSIACDRDVKYKDGNKVTDFFDITAFGKTAEFISNYYSKGRMMIVDGRLSTDVWEDAETGKKRKAVRIIANSVYFGDSKKDAEEKSDLPDLPESFESEDDELPF